MTHWKTIIIFSIFQIFSLSALSADITISDVKFSTSGYLEHAEVLVDGKIESGDGDKFISALSPLLDKAPPFGGFWDRLTLSLNSLGGDFDEALKISKYIRDNSIQTIVKRKSVCFSSCAIIFMHGVIITPDEEEFQSRTLELGGKIGFHAPYLVARDNITNTFVNVDEALRYASTSYNKALIQLAYLLETGNKIFPNTLIIEMLRTGPNELVMVDTIRDLIAWEIPVETPPAIRKLKRIDIAMTCENAWSKRVGEEPEISLGDLDDLSIELPRLEKEWESGSQLYSYLVQSHNGGYLSAECRLIVANDEAGLKVGLLGFDYNVDLNTVTEESATALPFRYMFDPSMKLTDVR